MSFFRENEIISLTMDKKGYATCSDTNVAARLSIENTTYLFDSHNVRAKTHKATNLLQMLLVFLPRWD